MTETRPKPFYRRLYEGWLVIAAHFGEVQTSVILFFSYVLAIGPAALVMQRKDLLHTKQLHQGDTAWSDADTTRPDLDRAKRLF